MVAKQLQSAHLSQTNMQKGPIQIKYLHEPQYYLIWNRPKLILEKLMVPRSYEITFQQVA